MTTTKPQLSQRAIVAYNRLCREVVALNYLTRVAKPSGTLGEHGRRSLNGALRIANRLYRREAGLPAFGLFDPAAALTVADVVLLVARLTAASVAFEERYAHLTRPAGDDVGGAPLSTPDDPYGLRKLRV